ncbi:MAG: exo-alpha-sialidase [Dactylosporangium sp.]|nr:exo-alpha-sialidase [Dactylosporangium sp.]
MHARVLPLLAAALLGAAACAADGTGGASSERAATAAVFAEDIVAVVSDTAWVRQSGGIFAIGPSGTRREVIPDAGPGAIAVGGENIWFAAGGDDAHRGIVTVHRSVDGGRTWTSLQVPVGDASAVASVRALDFDDGGIGWMMVSYGVSMGTEPVEIYRTDDFGATWRRLPGEASEGAGRPAGRCPTAA